jgi:hypothetical protein
VPKRRRPKRSTKSSRADAARPDAGLPAEPPAPEAATPEAPDPQAELAAAERVLEQQFPPPPPPPPPPPAGESDQGDDDELIDGAEGLAGEFEAHPDLLLVLDAEEFAAAYELAFGYVAERRERPHWELRPKSALRLGRLTRRVLLKHPELAAWLAQYLADVLLGLVLALEIGTRVSKDRKLDQARAAAAESVE